MAKRICLMTFYPTDCKDDCFNCECGGAEATKDMYVSINDVQRVCAIIGGASDTDEGEYVAEVIRNNLEHMVTSGADVQPLSVVAEHIKKRLYQTAFNTTEEKARDTIVDMAKRIDIWIDELGLRN